MEESRKLTKELALKNVEIIRRSSSDGEVAHTYEDSLRAWFIECVSAGMYSKKEAIEVAKIVKSTADIIFDRWCA